MWRQRYGSKYGAKRQDYNGILYHSKKEAGYAAELDLRVKAKDLLKWERQEKISIDVNGYHICNYYIDFTLYYSDGTKEYVEVKGFETETWRLKWKLFEALHEKMYPNSRITVVK